MVSHQGLTYVAFKKKKEEDKLFGGNCATYLGFPDPGFIPESGRSPREGNGNLLQYSCLENSMGRGAWQATVCGVAKELDTT